MKKFLPSFLIATVLLMGTATAQINPTETVVGNVWNISKQADSPTGPWALLDEERFATWEECSTWANELNEAAFGTGFLATCWEVPSVMLEGEDV